jgi:hypothetical protein
MSADCAVCIVHIDADVAEAVRPYTEVEYGDVAFSLVDVVESCCDMWHLMDKWCGTMWHRCNWLFV